MTTEAWVEEMDDEYSERILELYKADTETAHGEADDLLCELLEATGFSKTVEAFRGLNKWYA